VGHLAEALTVIKRLWTEPVPFDFNGSYVHLEGAFGSPKPVQRPHPPILIGGRSSATLRIVAEHADLWNIPGPGDGADLVERSARLDRYCAEIGRDPAAIVRSVHLPVSYADPGTTRAAIAAAVGAGFGHVVLGLPAPWPDGVARWVADELITPAL
jgi:alkanesulfonate monooxygenase SsuD/methylene tetrahydromethanopterin reductase-like flavin-dependent oxidoreductase (luciferase family)